MSQTDIAFLTLINERLDHIKAYNSERHYTDHIYMARRWVTEWDGLTCGEIYTEMIRSYLKQRKEQTSGYTANKELRCLRATFNFGMDDTRKWLSHNPTKGIQFFPVIKKVCYVPPKEDVLKVISLADSETQDYLYAIALTLGRMGEINRMTWQDVNFHKKKVTLYTRKSKGGNLTPRHIHMPDKLYRLLLNRHGKRKKTIPWVFWHRYWSRKKGEWVVGPYIERKRIMRTLCKKAGVQYFRFHPLRHFGASLLDSVDVPIGLIQRILGHQNRTTTEIYLHSIGESEKDAMDALDDEF